MIDQYIRNAIAFIGAIVFVLGGLYLIDQYSGWRPFEGRGTATEINGSADAFSPMAESGSDAHQVSNDFSGRRDETVTTQKSEQDHRMRRGRQSILPD